MQSDLFDLTGRTALITGGAGTLGRQHAAALLECGSQVVLADIDEVRLDEAVAELAPADGTLSGMPMDVSDLDSVEAVRDKLSRSGIQIGILINNAAIDPKVGSDMSFQDSSRLENFPLAEWNRQLEVGLTGAFLCAKVFGSGMAADRGGVIVNVASDLSVIAPDQRLYRQDGRKPEEQPVKPVTYSVIKTGLIGLTRYLATYWADQGVRVNAVSPGGVRAGQPDEFVRRVSDLVPLGRMAEPHDYRGVIQFLCSDASSYMTGQNVVVDGGRSVW